MSEEEKNIEWICSRTLLDEEDELVPIILKMLSETYIKGLKQGHFDRDMDLQNQQSELEKKDKTIKLMKEELANQYNNYEPCYLDDEMNCKKYETCEDCIKEYFERKVED